MPEDSKKRFDSFIAKVVNDPATPPETLLIQGFLGASSEADHTRVYADVTLDSYVDVPNADIIHVEPLPKEQSPLGGSYLWIRRSADVLPGSGEANRKGAKFLEGPIAAQAGIGGQAIGFPLANTIPLVACHPTILVNACHPSQGCPPSVQVLCPPSIHVVACPPSFHVTCPTHAPCATPNPRFCLQPTPHLLCPPPKTPFCPVTPFCPPPHTQFCVSVQVICPTVNPSHCVASGGPGCPVLTPQTPETPQQGGFGGGQAFAAMAAPAIPATQLPQACVATPASVCHCPSVPAVTCPTHIHCPSVLHCPSPNPVHCPTPAGNCPTPNHECPFTPNPVHCPTPNQMCPHPTVSFSCPSVAEICPTSSPLFC